MPRCSRNSGGGAAAAVVARHLAALRTKLAHRRFLDRKAEAGLLHATAALPPGRMLGVAAAVIRDKVGGSAGRCRRSACLLDPADFA